MLRRLSQFLALVAFIGLVVCVVLLSNYTPFNPTHRRYSSEMPQTTGNFTEVGRSAELILSKDLGVPRNERPDQRQCICNNPARPLNLQDCRVCIAYSQSVATFRRPDFVAPTFIAEAKNSQGLIYTGREIDQIGDYTLAARALGRPLYVYVRVNTRVDPEFTQLARSTGGDVVYYFTVPGWDDPLDTAARRGVLIFGGVLGVMVLYRVVGHGFGHGDSKPRTPRRPKDPLNRARESIEDAEEFMRRTEDRKRTDIDIEDSR